MSTDPPRPRDIEEIQFKLLEEGKIHREDAYALTLVTTGHIPFDEYQELISDRRNHGSRLGRFGVQISISLSIAAFSMWMLVKDRDSGEYLPILTAILGYWLPAPDYSKASSNKRAVHSKSLPAGRKNPLTPD